MDPLRRYFEGDRLAKTLGIELVEVGDGRATARMHFDKTRHANTLGIAHGGAIFSLADFAFAAACNSQGQLSVAVNCSINYLSAVQEGWLTAIAEEVRPHHKLATYVIKVLNEQGELIALMQAMAYRKRETVEEFLQTMTPAANN